jgi:tol-pal system protein YbgF
MRPLAGLALVALLALPGCASHSKGSLDRLKQRIEELAQAQAESQKRVEELNNRIFLLEDKVDTSRVAMESSGNRPQLPVIRLKPQLDPEEQPEAPGASEGVPLRAEEEEPPQLASSVVEEKRVDYAGDARKEGPRPVLRLYGSGTTIPSTRVAAPLPGPDPSTVRETLPVVPLPPRKVARRAATAASKPAVAPMRAYESALSMYRSGKYTAAAEAFRTFVTRYTRHAYADNAVYWLGECAYDMKDYRLALKIFRRVVEEYPTGNKAPDALLKMGFSYIKLKESDNAKTVLAQLVESFPKSQVARLASETLVRIQ